MKGNCITLVSAGPNPPITMCLAHYTVGKYIVKYYRVPTFYGMLLPTGFWNNMYNPFTNLDKNIVFSSFSFFFLNVSLKSYNHAKYQIDNQVSN